jgi:hypothetical protein
MFVTEPAFRLYFVLMMGDNLYGGETPKDF